MNPRFRTGVLVFPGSNCDHDCYHVLKHVLGQDTSFIWHKNESLDGLDCVVIPGGFSYGDYLRTGAIARFSPIMSAVEKFAADGGLVIGICNGFQILTEAGLLPGAMLRNSGLKFICRHVYVKVENNNTPFTSLCRAGQVLRIPIAHMDGNYYADADTLRSLQEEGRIVLRYSHKDGTVNSSSNPNGSLDNIAGIINRRGNVLGMMPHPERCAESILGSDDGRLIFESMISYMKQKAENHE